MQVFMDNNQLEDPDEENTGFVNTKSPLPFSSPINDAEADLGPCDINNAKYHTGRSHYGVKNRSDSSGLHRLGK